MLIELFQIIVRACTTVLVAACLLRFYLHFLKINIAPNSGNPLAQFLLPITNWLVLPIKRVISAGGRLDLASLFASYLLVFIQTGLLIFFTSNSFDVAIATALALFDWLHLILSGLIGVALVHVLFTWTGTSSPTQEMFYEMTQPLLRPIRKFFPSISGIDFSAFIFVVLIQITTVMLNHLQAILISVL